MYIIIINFFLIPPPLLSVAPINQNEQLLTTFTKKLNPTYTLNFRKIATEEWFLHYCTTNSKKLQ